MIATKARRMKLVPRSVGDTYSEQDTSDRREWLSQQTETSFTHVAGKPLEARSMRGNIENPIGVAQVPLGVVGPVQVNGEYATGEFYMPMATTEGALLRSYERGMALLTRAGGVTTRIYTDTNTVAPQFFFDDVDQAAEFTRWVPFMFGELKDRAEATTGHGQLVDLQARPLGRRVMLAFKYKTGDASGMNMIVKATSAACNWLCDQGHATRYQIFSGMASEKRASSYLFAGGKGKRVSAGCLIPAKMLKTYMRVTPHQMHELWEQTVAGHFEAGSVGFNGHIANGLAAMFIALGQDVANVANASVGMSSLELTQDGDLYASVNLPSLTIATVGGGVGLGTSRECLESMDCFGPDKARKLAEIMAATLLGGEISFSAAIAGGELVKAHETYGRNRPGLEPGSKT